MKKAYVREKGFIDASLSAFGEHGGDLVFEKILRVFSRDLLYDLPLLCDYNKGYCRYAVLGCYRFTSPVDREIKSIAIDEGLHDLGTAHIEAYPDDT